MGQIGTEGPTIVVVPDEEPVTVPEQIPTTPVQVPEPVPA